LVDKDCFGRGDQEAVARREEQFKYALGKAEL
jgi:hypothetical protein